MAELNKNLDHIEDANDYSELPDGEYLVIITESDFFETKSGEGRYLKLTMQVIQDEYENRLMWLNLNLDNQNATAVKIAEQQLKQIAEAVGIKGLLKDSVQLHDQPFKVVLGRNKKGEQTMKKFVSIMSSSGTTKKETTFRKPWE
jgi:hypothetical protein